jgi:hypothetical protein
MTRIEVLPAPCPRLFNRFVAIVAAALIAFPLSSSADMVATPKSRPGELEQALREARPGDVEKAEILIGPDARHAGAINSFLLQLIVYGSIVAVVCLVGIIAIIGYGFSKKEKRDDGLMPIR